jgi:threonine-phosphate decarboxylase
VRSFQNWKHLIAANSQTTFVVDEAFIDFTQSITSVIELVKRYKNVVILRSLTKTFSIPGLRLGYIAAHEVLIQQLKALKFPWSVNAMALEAGKYIFDHFEQMQLPLERLLNDKESFVTEVKRLPIDVIESHTHFFLAKLRKGTAAELKRYLIEHNGLLIRDASNFRGLSEAHFRLATLSPEQNVWMIEALKAWNSR